MAAQVNQKLVHNDDDPASKSDIFEVYDVVLYLEIIDILQDYNIKKKVEHTFKSFKFSLQSISIVKPKEYSKFFVSEDNEDNFKLTSSVATT